MKNNTYVRTKHYIEHGVELLNKMKAKGCSRLAIAIVEDDLINNQDLFKLYREE